MGPAVLHLHHVLGDPELGTMFVQHELRANGFIVIRSLHVGGRMDDSLEHAVVTERPGWSSLRFVLEGPILVRHGSSADALGRGDAFASIHSVLSTSRSLTNRSDVLAVAWRTGDEAARVGDGLVSLSPLARASLFRFSEAIATTDTSSAIASLREAVIALRASGIEVADVPNAPVSEGAREIGRALERVFFPLSARPMAIDLARELGVGERQALRRANAYFSDYHATVATWRDYVHGMRVSLSTFFISHPRARTEHVSRFLGFSSPTSFCHALHGAGLPSPSAVQRALLAA